MHFAFTEEQEELRSQAHGFLGEFSAPEQVRKAMESEIGYDPELWGRISAELGWPSVVIPDEYGGLGLSYVELIALMEEMGAALLCAPFLSSVCLAGSALLAGGTEEQKKEHLPGIAEGTTIGTLAYMEANGRPDATGIEMLARSEGGDFILSGTKTFVLDGHTAGLLVVAARKPGSTGEEGVSLFALPSDSPGLERRLLPTMDQTRKQAELAFREVRVPASALMGEEGEGWKPLSEALDLAAIALAAEQVGGAQRCLDMSVAYAKERVQFGRPIGSFQAIKHKCADMMVEVESARSASYYAGWAASQRSEDLPAAASLAKAFCSDTYFRCAADCLQIHGGVGFSWEYEVHLYFKRAKSTEILLGSPDYHRERVARQIGL
jgi:alkylation response protein AidB-like acyl-CoA dehydrogenase